jgi:uncharacterized protein
MSLATFLNDPARPEGTLRYHELQGFLFAIASAPELIQPSEWMPLVFDDAEPGYASLDEANEVLGEITSLYNEVNASVIADTAVLPADCVFRDDVLSNLDDAAPVSQWSRGFVSGHTWLGEVWDSYLPEDFNQEVAAMLVVLSFFASAGIAESFRQETAPDEPLDALATTIRRVFPQAVAEYAQLGRSISRVLAEREKAGRTPWHRQKIGRNEQCPCGSGRKYKKCCGTSAS